ncbi:ankyrin repeat-containing domain protein [Diplogelasinospora grovesii]|uniref:Ankyrin repeat-containing domain protein n=1 Tax=Diplogelasinospora grovesii TaxID=303347 RepID=A0AAN6RZV4_9PEZI|nr:ankyrin repeat-containing domain protein [Diplogelasinospora grovesii]
MSDTKGAVNLDSSSDRNSRTIQLALTPHVVSSSRVASHDQAGHNVPSPESVPRAGSTLMTITPLKWVSKEEREDAEGSEHTKGNGDHLLRLAQRQIVPGWLSPHTIDENGCSLLHIALLSRQFDIAQFLWAHRARGDSKDILRHGHDLKDRFTSALSLLQDLASLEYDGEEAGFSGIQSAAKGLDDVGQELENDPDSINRRDENGKAPLHWACQGGNAAVVKLLIREGADVNVADFGGQTPLMTAAHRGAIRCALALLTDDGCVSDKYDAQGQSAVHYAAASPYVGGSVMIGCLLSHRASPTRRNQGGETPLHELASSYTAALPAEELRDRAKTLLASGADLEAVDMWHYTLALQAVAEDNHRALGVLLGLGARIDVFDLDKQGMLHLITPPYCPLWRGGDNPAAQGCRAGRHKHRQPRLLRTHAIHTVQLAARGEIVGVRNVGETADRRRNQIVHGLASGIVQALDRGDVDLGICLLDGLLDKYARWIEDEEFETIRDIKMNLLARSSYLAKQALIECIKS